MCFSANCVCHRWQPTHLLPHLLPLPPDFFGQIIGLQLNQCWGWSFTGSSPPPDFTTEAELAAPTGERERSCPQEGSTTPSTRSTRSTRSTWSIRSNRPTGINQINPTDRIKLDNADQHDQLGRPPPGIERDVAWGDNIRQGTSSQYQKSYSGLFVLFDTIWWWLFFVVLTNQIERQQCCQDNIQNVDFLTLACEFFRSIEDVDLIFKLIILNLTQVAGLFFFFWN